MIIDDTFREEKLKYNSNREATNVSASTSRKIDGYEYLTSEEILPSNQSQMIEQAKLVYLPFKKAFKKQTKTTKDQRENHAKALKTLKFWKKING